MKRSAVAALVAYVTQLAPAQQFDEYTAAAWHDVLGDLDATFEQARDATAAVAREQQWIYPSAIREKLLPILAAAQPREPAPAIEQKRAWEQVEDRAERIACGAALVREALAKATPYRLEREDAPDIPENLRRAREAAVAHRARQRRQSDPSSLARTAGEALTQIHRARKANQ